VEGLVHCKDHYDVAAKDFAFDASDHFNYFPRILNQVSDRWWNNRIARLPGQANAWTMADFDLVYAEFVTAESGSLYPRDDLIAYLKTDDCKKPRKVSIRTHASRIESLCYYANCLQGVAHDLTELQITELIFQSFPNAWLNEFCLHKGNPLLSRCEVILQYFITKKQIQDDTEDTNKKCKKEDKGENGGNGNNKNKKQKGKADGAMCRKHKTHLWSKCSENPKSKNYFLNPKSPFYRGGQGGRNGGRGGYGGRGFGRGNDQGGYNSGGRGGGRGYGRGGNSYNGGEQHHNDYRGNDQSDDQTNHRDNYFGDQRGSGRGRGPHDHSGNHNSYHNNRPGGWY